MLTQITGTASQFRFFAFEVEEDRTLSLKAAFVKIRDGYVIRQAQNAKFPAFTSKALCRWKITFSGRVQKVGFRLEVCELAKRLSLTGYCKNLENGDVLAELQGPEDKVRYLIHFMESLRRIKIKNKVIEKLEIDLEEVAFVTR